MSTNNNAGPIKHMSVEDLARETNKSFWGASQEHKEAEEEMRMTPPLATIVGGVGGNEGDPDYEVDDDDYDGKSCSTPVFDKYQLELFVHHEHHPLKFQPRKIKCKP